MANIICIVCPKGCHLTVDESTLAVTGNACPRGAEYGKNELTHPVRVVTSTVNSSGSARVASSALVEPISSSTSRAGATARLRGRSMPTRLGPSWLPLR